MKITLCGSMQFDSEMTKLADELRRQGHEVDKPNVVEGHVYEDNLDANAVLKRGFIDEHFAKIDMSEAILVVNEKKNGIDGYIGGNTLIEIAYAYQQGLNLFLLNPVPEMSYADEIRGMHPTIIDGDIAKIHAYEASLPLVYMSTESALKHAAVSRAMRRAGVPVRVEGKMVDSGVNEQPMTMNETYDGAKNRQENLRALNATADYLVTVESGLCQPLASSGTYGCNAVIIEPAGAAARVGFAIDAEFPPDTLEQIPSVYADFGVWAQEVHGAAEKDPYPYITNGRLTRRDTIESAIYNVAIQLEEKRT